MMTLAALFLNDRCAPEEKHVYHCRKLDELSAVKEN